MCTARSEAGHASQTRDLSAARRTIDGAGMSEQAGGGSPALKTNPPLPLMENPAKQELPQPATATAQQRIPHKRTTSRDTPSGRVEWRFADSKIHRSKGGDSVPEMTRPQDPEWKGWNLHPKWFDRSTESLGYDLNHEDARCKHDRGLVILNCQNCQTVFVSLGERLAKNRAGSS